ncbi:MAG TPA: hypothetical protein VHQ65_06725 [Thermoanaerobaculia bacterium]|nr:hypothetical protein [Thermoanaerobaculia bacterium]
MRIFVGVTDSEWFRFLRNRPHLEEVNFWQPSGTTGTRCRSGRASVRAPSVPW